MSFLNIMQGGSPIVMRIIRTYGTPRVHAYILCCIEVRGQLVDQL